MAEDSADAPATAGAVLTEHGPVAEIVLANGPLNLVTRPLLRQLNTILGELAGRSDHARAFCAGSDIKEFGPLGADASERKILFEDMVLRNLARLPMPTIAAIDGPALGGGFEIALSCDLRILRAGVPVGLPECRLGGLAGSGAIRLTRLVGPARAKQMLFSGLTVASETALAWGLVNEVAEGETALAAARTLAGTICERGPLSNRLAKELVDLAVDLPVDAGLSRANVAQQRIFDSADLQEGASAFFEKREPRFSGR